MAEDQVEAHYRRRGFDIAARRWRGRGGEIDLIARDGDRVVFIEVKSAATFAAAAEHLSARQIARLCAAASEFLGNEPRGQDTEMRFDVALVDGTGRIDIIENAIGF
ncbi:YraN family protein [Defluviimonas sp. SAOS-178_SWC]|uniref:YraN family protein n=1 Tax=Defluviimonas sp. SAOS-178_SWC TaxID=3121287 RepID=UPI00322222A5